MTILILENYECDKQWFQKGEKVIVKFAEVDSVYNVTKFSTYDGREFELSNDVYEFIKD